MLALLLALMPILGYAAPENPPTIPPAEAAQHVGELVIVQGVVDQVSVSSRSLPSPGGSPCGSASSGG